MTNVSFESSNLQRLIPQLWSYALAFYICQVIVFDSQMAGLVQPLCSHEPYFEQEAAVFG